MWMLLAWASLAMAQSTVDLTIEVQPLRNGDGIVRIALFDSEERFLEPAEDAAVAHVSLKADKAGLKHTFSGLPPGIYAAAVFHDEDEDGKVSTNFIGIPKEGVGVTNNPRLLGPPKFKDAKFEMSETQTQQVQVKYLL